MKESKKFLFFIPFIFAAFSFVAKAQNFEPVCQVGSISGFCRHFAYTPLASTPAPDSAKKFCTYDRPFDIHSLWNIRPKQVALGTAVIPASTYFPFHSSCFMMLKSTASSQCSPIKSFNSIPFFLAIVVLYSHFTNLSIENPALARDSMVPRIK